MEPSMEYITTALEVLVGIEDKHWCYYETDLNWWIVRLWTRRN